MKAVLDRRALLAGGIGATLLPVTARAATTIADVRRLGDGRTLATRPLQAALDMAGRAGGGRVVVPAGLYLTGALFVPSRVTLEIARDATLLGSGDLADYPILPTRVAGIETPWPSALVNIRGADDAAIVGEGTIDGDGKRWWDAYRALRERYDAMGLRWAADYDCRRPRLIQLFEARRARVGDGLLLRRSGFWTMHLCYSRDVTVSGVTIRNNDDGRGPSTDGIDIDSSSGVLVERADIACNDDALCLKAGRDADGLRVARPSSDVVIRDCIVRDAAAGVTFGSETSGGIHDVTVERLRVLAPTPSAILFKSAHTRGGTVSGIAIRDVTATGMKTAVRIDLNWNPSYSYATIPAGIARVPPLWRTLATPVPPERGIPHLSDVTVTGLHATGTRRAFDVAAYPTAPLERFRFDGIAIDAPDGGTIADAHDWRFTHTTLAAPPRLRDSSGIAGL